MKNEIEVGLKASGFLPGKINVQRKAKVIYEAKGPKVNKLANKDYFKDLAAYAYAASESNASGEIVVTAPTCGAAGVLPAVLYYAHKNLKYSEKDILKALAVAGLIGDLFKTNGSISGAEAGCQAEVGSACGMAAAAYAYLLKLSLVDIETAAEIAIEHHLGLTCDPVLGYVQVPCIERNAVAAYRAINAANLAMLSDNTVKIFNLDAAIETMYETGKALQSAYRETSEGGLAKTYLRLHEAKNKKVSKAKSKKTTKKVSKKK